MPEDPKGTGDKPGLKKVAGSPEEPGAAGDLVGMLPGGHDEPGPTLVAAQADEREPGPTLVAPSPSRRSRPSGGPTLMPDDLDHGALPIRTAPPAFSKPEGDDLLDERTEMTDPRVMEELARKSREATQPTPPDLPAPGRTPAPVSRALSPSDEVPGALKAAAIVQIVTGLLDIFVVSTLGFITLSMAGLFTGSVGGALLTVATAGLCPIGILGPFLSLCGFISCLMVPLGLLEVIAGALGLMNPREHHRKMKLVAFIQPLGLLLGGVTSAVGAVVVLVLLRKPAVRTWLDEDL